MHVFTLNQDKPNEDIRGGVMWWFPTEDLEKIESSIEKDLIYHDGFLHYLAKAWENHYSIVIKPDNIWHTILSELVTFIHDNPKQYSHLFTNNPDNKQLILVGTSNVTKLPLEEIKKELMRIIPIDSKCFLPEFSTSSEESKMAMIAAFADMVSPYYSYGTFMCGFPSVQVDGEMSDWEKIKTSLNDLSLIFKDSKEIVEYLTRCTTVVKDVLASLIQTDQSNDFWKKMVKLKRCGSGHQFEMDGWILNLLRKNETVQLEGLPSHISKVEYKNFETKREFIVFYGLFSSKIENGFLIPQYNHIIGEKVEKRKLPNRSPRKTPIGCEGMNYYDHEDVVQPDGKIASFSWSKNEESLGWVFQCYKDPYGFVIVNQNEPYSWYVDTMLNEHSQVNALEYLYDYSSESVNEYLSVLDANKEQIHGYKFGGALSERGGLYITPKNDYKKVLRYKQLMMS